MAKILKGRIHPAHKVAARKAAETRARNRRIAIHEAGHAVIGRALGLPCGRATIKPDYDDGSAGHGIIHSPDEIQRLWWKFEDIAHRTEAAAFRARILAYMAGCEAEKMCLGRSRVGDADDRRQINLMFDSLLPRDADIVRIAQRMRATTRHLVRRHRATIERVAALLLQHRNLSPAQIDRAMPKSRGALRARRARVARQADEAAARRGETIEV
jgi:ATP-dependent Zn protease